jgi:hypothetical protein
MYTHTYTHTNIIKRIKQTSWVPVLASRPFSLFLPNTVGGFSATGGGPARQGSIILVCLPRLHAEIQNLKDYLQKKPGHRVMNGCSIQVRAMNPSSRHRNKPPWSQTPKPKMLNSAGGSLMNHTRPRSSITITASKNLKTGKMTRYPYPYFGSLATRPILNTRPTPAYPAVPAGNDPVDDQLHACFPGQLGSHTRSELQCNKRNAGKVGGIYTYVKIHT